MKSAYFERSILVLGTLLTLATGCAGAPDDGSAGVANTQEAFGRATWARGRGPLPRPTAPLPTTTTPPASTTPPVGTAAPPQSADAIIAAARTPDGSAIPQPAGPNGACPAVVALLGFWACPTEGSTCSYASGGVTHDCVCDRVDGEGQTPAWVCN